MQINFLGYFQIEAAAKGDVPFLLNLDFLINRAQIDRQETEQLIREVESRRLVENQLESACKQIGESEGQTDR